MSLKAYLAGPDVFLPNSAIITKRKIDICLSYGVIGLSPADNVIVRKAGKSEHDFAEEIYLANIKMMGEADLIIANLTPFRGPSADSGTVFELGWFVGGGKRALGYSNSSVTFRDRSQLQTSIAPDDIKGTQIESFGLPDNLMLPFGIKNSGGYRLVTPDDQKIRHLDDLDIFEMCVRIATGNS
jgi:nucleoside 2-deoxyribosyltransferase